MARGEQGSAQKSGMGRHRNGSSVSCCSIFSAETPLCPTFPNGGEIGSDGASAIEDQLLVSRYGLGNYNLYRRTGEGGRRQRFLGVADWLVENGREFICAHYSRKQRALQYLRILERLADKRGCGGGDRTAYYFFL